ncbi:MAG: FAD-binding protein, partial [candidate division Zixibacteria bacterium]|nr:FAD-binding protein [candidate division Zixibacteria bacterium]
GGIVSDLYGQTDIEGMYVCGESAFTGMHGANRLASNSLLEAVVMSDYSTSIAIEYYKKHKLPKSPPVKKWLHSSIAKRKNKIVISHDKFSLRKLMSDFMGIVRSSNRLTMAHNHVKLILKEIDSIYMSHPSSYDIIELRNIAQVANLIIRCALRRKESRGLHYITDYPETEDKKGRRNTIIKPPNYKPLRRNNVRK